MLSHFKHKVKSWLRNQGVFVRRGEGVTGVDIGVDLTRLSCKNSPVILDVGANRGQSIKFFQDCFKNPKIFAFEPSEKIFGYLKSQDFGPSVEIFNLALGKNKERDQRFYNYNKSGFNSFLEVDNNEKNPFGGYLEVKSVQSVDTTTIDSFLAEQGIESADLVKIDTQGFDLEVIKGALQAMKQGRIKLILTELNMINLYKGQNSFIEILSILDQYNFQLIDLYDKSRMEGAVNWCNGLFKYNP